MCPTSVLPIPLSLCIYSQWLHLFSAPGKTSKSSSPVQETNKGERWHFDFNSDVSLSTTLAEKY